jgi:hypothetical protein
MVNSMNTKIGSQLAPIVASYFTEDSEHQVLNTAYKKPSCWYWYVDDTFVIWPQEVEEL